MKIFGIGVEIRARRKTFSESESGFGKKKLTPQDPSNESNDDNEHFKFNLNKQKIILLNKIPIGRFRCFS